MKAHTKGFKDNISLYGRKLNTKIFYEINGVQKVLDGDKIENVNIITNTDLLKTVMKQVEFQSKNKIPKGTIINVKNGVKVDNEFEYIDFGNFIVHESYWNVDINSYTHICYDNMLKTMIDYSELNIKYPIKLREYINEIAEKCGLEFANINDEFVNYNVDITKDNFNNGSYTFRDVLDYVCELIGGWLVINENDKLSVKYPTENEEIFDIKENGETLIVDNKKENKNIVDYKIYGDSFQNKTSGKNLFDVYSANWQKNNLTSFSYGSDKNTINFTTKTTHISGIFIGKPTVPQLILNFDENKEYTVSFEITSNVDIKQTRFGFEGYFLNTSLEANKTKKIVSKSLYGALIIYFENATQIANVEVKNIMITDNDDTEFEYYTNGASPNPSFQQEIINVGDLITNESDENFGKYKIPIDVKSENLFDKNNFNIANLYVNNSNVITGSQTAITFYIKCKPNTEYIINKSNAGTNNRFCVFTTEQIPTTGNKVIDIVGTKTGEDSSITYTIKTSNNANYLSVFTSVEKTTPTYQEIAETLEIKEFYEGLEIPTKIPYRYTPYYKETKNIYLNEPLRKIGEYQDYIDFKNKKVVRNVKKILLNNNFNWKVNYYETEKRIYTSKNDIDTSMVKVSANTDLGLLMSEKYNSATVNDILDLKVKYGIGLSLGGYLSIVNPDFSTGTDFVNDLQNNPIDLYYATSTPIEEIIELPDLELSNINNIITVDTILKPNIELTYKTNEGIPTFNGDFLKDYNINFNKKYGAINSVVFSRGLGNDNIYRKDDNSINSIGLHEIKIENNPFLEGDDRENFIQGVYDKLKGLEFYVMDVDSTGITYLDVGDYYKFDLNKKNGLKSGTVKSGVAKAQTSDSGVYKCLLLNNEILINDGLSERLYTDEPEDTYTNYKTSAPTDKSVKNAIIQVDKNKGEIVLKTNSDGKIVQVRLDADADTGSVFNVDADNINLTANDIINLIAGNSINLTSKNITIDSTNFKVDKDGNATLNNAILTGGEIKSNNYIQNSTGTKINLSNGVIDSKNFKIDSNGNATLNNAILSGGEIKSSNYKENEVGTKINLSTGVIDTKNFKINNDGTINATGGAIGGFNLNKKQFYNNINGIYDYSKYDLITVQAYILNLIQSSTFLQNIYNYNGDNIINALDLLKISKIVSGTDENSKSVQGRFEINSENPKNCLSVYSSDNEIMASIGVNGVNAENLTGRNLILGNPNSSSEDKAKVIASGDSGTVTCVSVVQTSKEQYKKNFEKLENALDIVKNTDIYKYNMKSDEDTDKKHIGFVIGDNYNYSQDITSKNNDGVDIYSFVSVCCKAIQEQQEQIEQLKQEIKSLKERIDN